MERWLCLSICLRLAWDVSPLSGHSRSQQRKLSRFAAPPVQLPWPTSQVAFKTGWLCTHPRQLFGASCGPASYNSCQNRYFSHDRRDGSLTIPKHVPYANKIVTGGRKTFHQQRRQGKYQVECSSSSHPWREQGTKKKLWSALSLPKPRADRSSHDHGVWANQVQFTLECQLSINQSPVRGSQPSLTPLGGTMLMCIGRGTVLQIYTDAREAGKRSICPI